MLGFSLAELVAVCLIAILLIKPKDLPEIAYFLGRIYYKIKKFFLDAKSHLANAEKEFGLEEIKKEFLRAKMSVENEEKITEIIDIYGNVHKVEADKIRSDLTKEELDKEVEKYNRKNLESASEKP